MDHASRALTLPFQADGDCQSRRYLQRDLGERGGYAIDVATGDVVADLKEHEKHAEEQRGCVTRACRAVVGALTQQIAGESKRCCRYSIPVEDSIKDWRRLHHASDDAG